MNEEEKELLESTYELAKSNNKILKGMRRKERVSTVFHAIKWIAIIAITIWSYVLIQPVLSQISGVYQNVQETTSAVKGLQDRAQDLQNGAGFENLLQLFKN